MAFPVWTVCKTVVGEATVWTPGACGIKRWLCTAVRVGTCATAGTAATAGASAAGAATGAGGGGSGGLTFESQSEVAATR